MRLRATGIAVVHDGKMVAQWGDVKRKVNVASVRKSLLSALYGIAVADGRIAESTISYSETDRRDRGYGYMWWTLRDPAFGTGAFLASGFGGQLLVVIPSKRLVVAQTVDRQINPQGVRAGDFLAVVKLILAASP
jgi:CubicO group peptidase (beta-lactamase class C family)